MVRCGGQGHAKAGAAFCPLQAQDLAAMAPGDLADQAEAEADAAFGFAGAGAAVERREDRFPLRFGNAGAAIAEFEQEQVGRGQGQPHLDWRGAVPGGIFQQIAHHAAEQRAAQ